MAGLETKNLKNVVVEYRTDQYKKACIYTDFNKFFKRSTFKRSPLLYVFCESKLLKVKKKTFCINIEDI